MMRSRIHALLIAAACVAGAYPGALHAQAPGRSYSWYGEMVSVDRAARAATVKVQISEPVTRYTNRFKSGDRVILTWNAYKGEADAVINVATPEAMKIVDVGYILPVEFVSADGASRTMVVKTVVPEGVLAALTSVSPGGWIKVAAPMAQKGPEAVLASAAPSTKPAPRPKEVVVDPNAGPPANPKAPTAQLAGIWAIDADLFGNPANSDCTIMQEGPKLTGKCEGALGASALTGEVTGNVVKFRYSLDVMGMMLEFAHDGTVDSGAKEIKGTMTVYGMPAPFSATRK